MACQAWDIILPLSHSCWLEFFPQKSEDLVLLDIRLDDTYFSTDKYINHNLGGKAL